MSHRAASHRAQDRTALALVVIVGFFVVASMTVIVIFAFSGVPSGENIWAGLFSIITAILGGITGYLGGQAVPRTPPKEAPDASSRRSP